MKRRSVSSKNDSNSLGIARTLAPKSQVLRLREKCRIADERGRTQSPPVPSNEMHQAPRRVHDAKQSVTLRT